MVAIRTPITLEEFLTLPEEKPALEFADGVVTQKMSAKMHHSVVQGALITWLGRVSGERVLAIPELRVTFAGASLVPDVSVFRVDRMPLTEHGRFVEDVCIPPDVAIEIVSPRQSVNALVGKCRWYVTNGVQVALLVDPADESVIAFRPGDKIAEWRGTDRIELGEVLPELDLTVDRLFAALRPGTADQSGS
jgi:Uma2 family endonuclease